MNHILPNPYLHSASFWESDLILQHFFYKKTSQAAQNYMLPHLQYVGKAAATYLNDWSKIADKKSPELQKRNFWGENINQINFTPEYFKMLEVAVNSKMFAVKWQPELRQNFENELHTLGFTAGFLFANTESGLYCPLCMTDGAARIIDRYADTEDKARLLPHIYTHNYEHLFTGAMFLTEKSGGSDVGANEVAATHTQAKTYLLNGEKWFCSNANAQIILALARTNPQIKGTKGLSIFLVEQEKLQIPLNFVRLKDKLGVRSMASAECIFENTPATLIGNEGDGFKIMTDMINLSRLYNAVAAIGCARRALNEAYQYVNQRVTFGKTTIEHPLVLEKLHELATLYQLNFYLTFRTIAALDASDSSSVATPEEALLRLLTPFAKRSTAQSCVYIIRECMELMGGIGYIEDGIMPKLLRDALVLPIWEGTGNIMILDMLRAIEKTNCLPLLFTEIDNILKKSETQNMALFFDKELLKSELADVKIFFSLQKQNDKYNEVEARCALEKLIFVYQIALLLSNYDQQSSVWIQPALQYTTAQLQQKHNKKVAYEYLTPKSAHNIVAWQYC